MGPSLQWYELLSQLTLRSTQARLDRALRQLEQLGRFAGGQAVDHRGLQHLSKLR
jgi:hypothetical protein